MLETEVTDISKKNGAYAITAGVAEIEAKYVINCAGVNSDDIHNMIAPEAF